MNTLREFYESEATESLRALADAAREEAGGAERLLSSARVLRGSALLAGDDRVYDVAVALTASLQDGSAAGLDDFRARLRGER